MLAEFISWKKVGQAFNFLAYVVNNSPDEVFVDQMRKQFHVSDEDPSPDDIHIGRKLISDYFKEHPDTPIHELAQELAVDWTRLFRGLSPSYGPPPPYEGVYRQGMEATIIQELNRTFSKHGLSVSEQRHDRSDYLGYELDFVRYLSEQASQAQEGGESKEEKRYHNELCKFIKEHLSTWVSTFCIRAAEHAQTSFYAGFLLLLEETVSDVIVNLCSMSPSEESYE